MTMNRTVVRIFEVCIDGDVRLRDGFDENQGRVEVCYNKVWGTVCSDGGWSGGGRLNARVVCRQLGTLSERKERTTSCTNLYLILSFCTFSVAAVSFTGAVFGPGSVFAPVHLDNVFCIGNESNLLNCQRNPVGVHDCSHSQDVSVDCLGRLQGTIHACTVPYNNNIIIVCSWRAMLKCW
jgi:deleted-in-malignant-brain-tumors protein 1